MISTVSIKAFSRFSVVYFNRPHYDGDVFYVIFYTCHTVTSKVVTVTTVFVRAYRMMMALRLSLVMFLFLFKEQIDSLSFFSMWFSVIKRNNDVDARESNLMIVLNKKPNFYNLVFLVLASSFALVVASRCLLNLCLEIRAYNFAALRVRRQKIHNRWGLENPSKNETFATIQKQVLTYVHDLFKVFSYSNKNIKNFIFAGF